MNAIHHSTVASSLFATVVTALVLTATQSDAMAKPVASATRNAKGGVVVYQLPRVVVTGRVQRVEARVIAELPRVVMSARRVGAANTLLSQASQRNPAGS